MTTPIINRDLSKQAPHSPRDRFGGFAILARTVDKCRAGMAGTPGEYHYDCPLDRQLFTFKGIDAAKFRIAISFAKYYEEVAVWLQANCIPRSPAEIKTWSDTVEALKLKDVPSLQAPDRRPEVEASCKKLGLNFESATLFEWLETDDHASFQKTSFPNSDHFLFTSQTRILQTFHRF